MFVIITQVSMAEAPLRFRAFAHVYFLLCSFFLAYLTKFVNYDLKVEQKSVTRLVEKVFSLFSLKQSALYNTIIIEIDNKEQSCNYLKSTNNPIFQDYF